MQSNAFRQRGSSGHPGELIEEKIKAMPIYLKPPAHKPTGPDGEGRNRLRIDILEPTPRCALRPRQYSALREAFDTRLAQWGGHFDVCDGPGKCGACPRLERRFELDAFGDRVMVRIDSQGRPYAMDRPEEGWGSWSMFLSWADIGSIEGWRVGPQERDDVSGYFWMTRTMSGQAVDVPR